MMNRDDQSRLSIAMINRDEVFSVTALRSECAPYTLGASWFV